MLIYSVLGIVFEWNIGKLAFSLICFVVLVHLAEEIQRKWKKDGNSSNKEHLAWISPFVLWSSCSTRAGKSEEFDLSEHLDFITSREEILYSNAAVSEKQVNDAQKDYLALREIIGKSKLRYRIMLLLRR